MTASNKIEILCNILEGEKSGELMVLTVGADEAWLFEKGATFSRESDDIVARFEVLGQRPA